MAGVDGKKFMDKGKHRETEIGGKGRGGRFVTAEGEMPIYDQNCSPFWEVICVISVVRLG